MRAYYDQRASEYDDWQLGTGLFSRRERPGWAAEVAALMRWYGDLRLSGRSTWPAAPDS
jgi:hypothetical protein